MRVFAIIMVFVLATGTLLVLGEYVRRKLIHAKTKQARRQKAEFIGGPLNKQTLYLDHLGDFYIHTYNDPMLVRGLEKEGRHYHDVEPYLQEAIYDHQGDGVYTYRGSVAADEVLKYDVDGG